MIVKICRDNGYDYFECDSVNVDVLAWGNRDLLNRETRYFLNPNIQRSEVRDSIGKDLPYFMKLLELRKGEKYTCIVTDVTTFLMNDEGKTIDRIN